MVDHRISRLGRAAALAAAGLLGAAATAPVQAAPAEATGPAATRAAMDDRLAVQMNYVVDVLEDKNVRHRLVRTYLEPVFRDDDGRDRFLLNLVAEVRRAGILDAKLRRVRWSTAELDPDYGYAEVEVDACGRWHLWIPRCLTTELRWRWIEQDWFLLPPEQIRLDPDLD